MLPRCAMILQADSHDVSLVKNIIGRVLAGHVMYVDPLPNHLAGNCASKYLWTMFGKVWWTPPDFFLWRCVKDQVYKIPVHGLADLQERNYAAVSNVTPQILHNTWVRVEYRLDISCATDERHVEVYGTYGKISHFSLIVAIGFIYRFVLVNQKL